MEGGGLGTLIRTRLSLRSTSSMESLLERDMFADLFLFAIRYEEK